MKTSRIVVTTSLAGVVGFFALIWWAHKNQQRSMERQSVYEAHVKQVQDSLLKVQEEKKSTEKRLMRASDSLINKRKYDAALSLCDSALATDSNFVDARLEKSKIFRLRKQYKQAMEECAAVMRQDARKGGAWYERALCYVAQGKKKEAVDDLRQAMELNYPEAAGLYDKINPVKRRIAGSHCVCCDGSISYSSGRGTCSHHGGVCGTEYDYETYREY